MQRLWENFYGNETKWFNFKGSDTSSKPLTPKILMLILPSSCYTSPCKSGTRISCQIRITTLTWYVWIFSLPVCWTCACHILGRSFMLITGGSLRVKKSIDFEVQRTRFGPFWCRYRDRDSCNVTLVAIWIKSSFHFRAQNLPLPYTIYSLDSFKLTHHSVLCGQMVTYWYVHVKCEGLRFIFLGGLLFSLCSIFVTISLLLLFH